MTEVLDGQRDRIVNVHSLKRTVDVAGTETPIGNPGGSRLGSREGRTEECVG